MQADIARMITGAGRVLAFVVAACALVAAVPPGIPGPALQPLSAPTSAAPERHAAVAVTLAGAPIVAAREGGTPLRLAAQADPPPPAGTSAGFIISADNVFDANESADAHAVTVHPDGAARRFTARIIGMEPDLVAADAFPPQPSGRDPAPTSAARTRDDGKNDAKDGAAASDACDLDRYVRTEPAANVGAVVRAAGASVFRPSCAALFRHLVGIRNDATAAS